MVNFKIQFGYNEVIHTAIIHRIPATERSPLHFLVSDIEPSIKNSQPVFFYHPEKEMPDFGGDNKVALKIIKAIKDYCTENNILSEETRGTKT